MQQLTHGTKVFVTSDAVAEALLELAAEIRGQQHLEPVTVPAFMYEGHFVETLLLLSPGVELIAVAVNTPMAAASETVATAAAVVAIRHRIADMEHLFARPVIDGEQPFPEHDRFYD